MNQVGILRPAVAACGDLVTLCFCVLFIPSFCSLPPSSAVHMQKIPAPIGSRRCSFWQRCLCQFTGTCLFVCLFAVLGRVVRSLARPTKFLARELSRDPTTDPFLMNLETRTAPKSLTSLALCRWQILANQIAEVLNSSSMLYTSKFFSPFSALLININIPHRRSFAILFFDVWCFCPALSWTSSIPPLRPSIRSSDISFLGWT